MDNNIHLKSNFLHDISLRCSQGCKSGDECLMIIYKNVEDMLRARGYRTVRLECNNCNEVLSGIFQNACVATGRDGIREDVNVYIYGESKVGVKYIRSLLETISCDTISIILSNEGPTSFARKDASSGIQFLLLASLFNNITKHELVPRHVLLSEEEKSAVAAKYNVVSDKQWPQIPLKDPLCQYYDFRRGELIEITRKLGGVKENDYYYRLVV